MRSLVYPPPMRNLLLAVALASAAASGCSKSDKDATAKADDLPTMTVDQVDQAIAKKEVTPVDCNHDQLRKNKGVVPGAVLVSSADGYAESELPKDKAAKYVFYCADPG